MRPKLVKLPGHIEAVPPAKESEVRVKADLEVIDMSVFESERVEEIARIVGENYLLYLEFVEFKKCFGDLGVATLLALEPIYRESMKRGPEAVLFDMSLIKGYLKIMYVNSASFEIKIMPILHKIVLSCRNWTFPEFDRLYSKVLYAINSVYLVRMQKQFMEKNWDDYGEFILFWSNIELLMKEFTRKDGFEYLKQVLNVGLN